MQSEAGIITSPPPHTHLFSQAGRLELDWNCSAGPSEHEQTDQMGLSDTLYIGRLRWSVGGAWVSFKLFYSPSLPSAVSRTMREVRKQSSSVGGSDSMTTTSFLSEYESMTTIVWCRCSQGFPRQGRDMDATALAHQCRIVN